MSGRRCGRVFGCSCGRCVDIWARDRRKVWRHALASYGAPVGIVTVTAPGSDVLPWAERVADVGGPAVAGEDGRPRPPTRYSGLSGDRVEPRAAYRWNSTAHGRRRRMWRAMGQRLRRRGYRRLVLGYVWEPQRRGVGHLHVVVSLPGARVVAETLRELAPSYGFGFVDDGSRSRRRGGGGGVAGYLVGYLNGSKVAESVQAVENGVIPHRSWYLASWLTMASGVTMRMLRRVRRWWAAAMGLLPPAPDMGCALVLQMADALLGARRAPPSRTALLVA